MANADLEQHLRLVQCTMSVLHWGVLTEVCDLNQSQENGMNSCSISFSFSVSLTVGVLSRCHSLLGHSNRVEPSWNLFVTVVRCFHPPATTPHTHTRTMTNWNVPCEKCHLHLSLYPSVVLFISVLDVKTCGPLQDRQWLNARTRLGAQCRRWFPFNLTLLHSAAN